MDKVRLEPGASDGEQDALLAEILDVAVEAGRAALDRTPEQLPVLAEHGVVDAGGYGLLLLVAGFLAGLRGEARSRFPTTSPPETVPSHHEDSRFRWCSNFVVVGEGIDPQAFVPRLEELGDSVMVVGDRDAIRVHIHTNKREDAKALFADLGEMTQEDHADMWRQIEARDRRLRVAPGRTGVIAVAAGAGMRTLLEGFGAYVVDGGPTLNPSPHELLRGIEDFGAPEAIVLPNSRNVIMAAQQAAELSDRPVLVVPSSSQQARARRPGRVRPRCRRRENADKLTAALAEIRTGAVAPAAKPDPQGRFLRGDAVGFEGDEIVAWGGEGSTLAATTERLAKGAEILTILQGADARLGDRRAADRPPRRHGRGQAWRPAPLLVADRGAVSDSPLLDEVMDAHGGLERWRAARAIRARVRSGGFLLRTRVPGNRFADYRLTVEPRRSEGHVRSLPAQGTARRLRSLRCADRERGRRGDRVSSRSSQSVLRPLGPAPQPSVGRPRLGVLRRLRDVELPREPVPAEPRRRRGEEGEAWDEHGERWRRLEVAFPPGLDTHSQHQSFYFDSTLRLRRHDYVADVIGGWARVAHRCEDHVEAGGLVFPTRRWVRPLGPGNRPLPFPTMVWLKIDELRVETE